MLFDTHAHYTDEAFDADRDEVIRAVRDSGVERVMNSSSDEKSSREAIALAEKYDFIYASVGWHPEDAAGFSSVSAELIREWVRHPKVRAIGEIGLDYHYDDAAPRELQKEVLERQMQLALELNMPVVIHDREAHGDCMELVRKYPALHGAFHCFSGSVEMARELLDRGWYLGFTGVITFKNARKALEVLEMCPTDRILIETDCPYMAPVPHRGERNDSRFLKLMAEKVAAVKGLSPEEAAALTTENGKRLFGIE
ncbi:MAG: TatD family hydrolase [Oscillospiraceae bacterium]|jgi:TatD DNase family protein